MSQSTNHEKLPPYGHGRSGPKVGHTQTKIVLGNGPSTNQNSLILPRPGPWMLHPIQGAQLEPQGGDRPAGVLRFEGQDVDVSDNRPRLEGMDRLDYGLGLESGDGSEGNIEKESSSSTSSEDSYLGLITVTSFPPEQGEHGRFRPLLGLGRGHGRVIGHRLVSPVHERTADGETDYMLDLEGRYQDVMDFFVEDDVNHLIRENLLDVLRPPVPHNLLIRDARVEALNEEPDVDLNEKPDVDDRLGRHFFANPNLLDRLNPYPRQQMLDRPNQFRRHNIHNQLAEHRVWLRLLQFFGPNLELTQRQNLTITHGPVEVQNVSMTQTVCIVLVGVYLFCSTALLSTSYALNEGGWIALVIYLVFLATTFFTGYIIPDCFGDEPTQRTYVDLGGLAFGERGRMAVWICTCVFSYATCIDCAMANHEILIMLFPQSEPYLSVLSVLIPALVVFFWSVNEYNPVWNGIGVFLTVAVILCFASVGVSSVGFHLEETHLFHTATTHLSIGFFSWCLCGHYFLPLVYSRVQNQRAYCKILLIIFGISTALYIGTACIGYGIFSSETKSIVVMNLNKSFVLSQIAMVFTVLNNMLRYTLNITSLAVNLEALLPVNYRTFVCRMLFRSVLVATTAVAFFGSHHYGPFVSLMGSIVGVVMSLIIPATCYLCIKWNNLPPLKSALCCVSLLVAGVSLILVIVRSSANFSG